MQSVADVINQSNGQWNVQKLPSLVSQLESDAISSIPLPVLRSGDKLVWHYTPSPSGVFSVKSGYHLAIQSSHNSECNSPESSFKPYPGLWKLKVPNKVRNFWWRVCKNTIASKENLFKRRCAPSNICPISNSQVESSEYLLFHCSWARAVLAWKQLSFHWFPRPS